MSQAGRINNKSVSAKHIGLLWLARVMRLLWVKRYGALECLRYQIEIRPGSGSGTYIYVYFVSYGD